MNITIAVTLFLTYTLIMCSVNKAIPESLSKIVLNLPSPGKWLWTIVILATSGLTFPSVIDNSTDGTRFIAFFSLLAMIVVAVSPLDEQDDSPIRKAHTIAAYAAVVTSQLLVTLNHPLLLLLWLPYLVAIPLYFYKKKINTYKFWAEITSFLIIFVYAIL